MPHVFDIYSELLMKQLTGGKRKTVDLSPEKMQAALAAVERKIVADGPSNPNNMNASFESFRKRQENPDDYLQIKPDSDTINGMSRYEYSKACRKELMKSVERSVRQALEWRNAAIRLGLTERNGNAKSIDTHRWMDKLMKTDGSPESLEYNESIVALAALGNKQMTEQQYVDWRVTYYLRKKDPVNWKNLGAAEESNAFAAAAKDRNSAGDFIYGEVRKIVDHTPLDNYKIAVNAIASGDFSNEIFAGIDENKCLEKAFEILRHDAVLLGSEAKMMFQILKQIGGFNLSQEEQAKVNTDWVSKIYPYVGIGNVANLTANPYFAIIDPYKHYRSTMPTPEVPVNEMKKREKDVLAYSVIGEKTIYEARAAEIYENILKKYEVNLYSEVDRLQGISVHNLKNTDTVVILEFTPTTANEMVGVKVCDRPGRLVSTDMSERVQGLLDRCAGWSRESHTSNEFENMRGALEALRNITLIDNPSTEDIKAANTAFTRLKNMTNAYLIRKQTYHNGTKYEKARIKFAKDVMAFANKKLAQLDYCDKHIKTVSARQQQAENNQPPQGENINGNDPQAENNQPPQGENINGNDPQVATDGEKLYNELMEKCSIEQIQAWLDKFRNYKELDEKSKEKFISLGNNYINCLKGVHNSLTENNFQALYTAEQDFYDAFTNYDEYMRVMFQDFSAEVDLFNAHDTFMRKLAQPNAFKEAALAARLNPEKKPEVKAEPIVNDPKNEVKAESIVDAQKNENDNEQPKQEENNEQPKDEVKAEPKLQAQAPIAENKDADKAFGTLTQGLADASKDSAAAKKKIEQTINGNDAFHNIFMSAIDNGGRIPTGEKVTQEHKDMILEAVRKNTALRAVSELVSAEQKKQKQSPKAAVQVPVTQIVNAGKANQLADLIADSDAFDRVFPGLFIYHNIKELLSLGNSEVFRAKCAEAGQEFLNTIAITKQEQKYKHEPENQNRINISDKDEKDSLLYKTSNKEIDKSTMADRVFLDGTLEIVFSSISDHGKEKWVVEAEQNSKAHPARDFLNQKLKSEMEQYKKGGDEAAAHLNNALAVMILSNMMDDKRSHGLFEAAVEYGQYDTLVRIIQSAPMFRKAFENLDPTNERQVKKYMDKPERFIYHVGERIFRISGDTIEKAAEKIKPSIQYNAPEKKTVNQEKTGKQPSEQENKAPANKAPEKTKKIIVAEPDAEELELQKKNPREFHNFNKGMADLLNRTSHYRVEIHCTANQALDEAITEIVDRYDYDHKHNIHFPNAAGLTVQMTDALCIATLKYMMNHEKNTKYLKTLVERDILPRLTYVINDSEIFKKKLEEFDWKQPGQWKQCLRDDTLFCGPLGDTLLKVLGKTLREEPKKDAERVEANQFERDLRVNWIKSNDAAKAGDQKTAKLEGMRAIAKDVANKAWSMTDGKAGSPTELYDLILKKQFFYDETDKLDFMQEDTVSKVVRGLLCNDLPNRLVRVAYYEKEQQEKKNTAPEKNGKEPQKKNVKESQKQNVKGSQKQGKAK